MTIYNITVNADSDTGRESQKRESARTSTKQGARRHQARSKRVGLLLPVLCCWWKEDEEKGQRKREKIAFDSLRFASIRSLVPWFWKRTSVPTARETPTRTKDEDEVWNEPRSYTYFPEREQTEIRTKREKEKRESERARGSKADRIISYLLLPLPSLLGLEQQTQSIRTIIFGAFDETSRTSKTHDIIF